MTITVVSAQFIQENKYAADAADDSVNHFTLEDIQHYITFCSRNYY